jgi:transposase-like protein
MDKHGKTVDFLLLPDRSIAAAQAFFRKALTTSLPWWPRKVTLDGYPPSNQALRLLRREDPKWKFAQSRGQEGCCKFPDSGNVEMLHGTCLNEGL